MDPQIEELKELVRQNIALSQDTNRIVHGMRRSAWIGGTLRLLWIGLIIAASVATYWYLAPYLSQVEGIYSGAQKALQQAQQFTGQFNTGTQNNSSSTQTPQATQ